MSTSNSTQHYRGRVISVTVDDVTLPNGRQAALEVVHHPGGAAIVALNDLQQDYLGLIAANRGIELPHLETEDDARAFMAKIAK